MIANEKPWRYARSGDMIGFGIMLVGAYIFHSWIGLEARDVGTSFWISMLIATLIGLLYGAGLAWAMKGVDGNLFSLVREHTGRIGGMVLAVAFSVIACDSGLSSMGSWANIAVRDYLPHTSNWIIVLIGLAPVILFVLLGLPVIMRTAGIFTPIAMIFLIIMMGLAASNEDISHIFPIMGYGVGPTLHTGLRLSSIFGNLMLLCLAGAPTQRGKSLIASAGIGGLLMVLMSFVFVLNYSFFMPETPRTLLQGIAEMTDYGRYIPQMQVFFIFLWVVALLLTFAASVICLARAWCHVFDIKDPKPVGMVIALLVALPIAVSPGQLPEIAISGFPQWVRLSAMLAVFLVAIIAKIRKTRAKHVERSEARA